MRSHISNYDTELSFICNQYYNENDMKCESDSLTNYFNKGELSDGHRIK